MTSHCGFNLHFSSDYEWLWMTIILKEISPEYSLEGLMLKLKLQYFGHLMRRTDSLGKDPDAGKDWRWEDKGMIEDEKIGQGSLVCCMQSVGYKQSDKQSVGYKLQTEWLSWTEWLMGASQVAIVVKNPLANAGDIKRLGFDPWVMKIPWRKEWQPTPVFLPEESLG